VTVARKELPRKEWSPIYMGNSEYLCSHCALERREHINGVYCPEWRLRQLDGDR